MAEVKPVIPTFQSRSEQLVFYIKRFAEFCVDVFRDSGCHDVPDKDKLRQMFDTIPGEIFIAYVLEMRERFGKELDAEDLSVVAKVVALVSQAKTAAGISTQMTNFVQALEGKPELKKKFFSYVKLITKLVKD